MNNSIVQCSPPTSFQCTSQPFCPPLWTTHHLMYIRNYKDFTEFINPQAFPSSEPIASFDVVSLFTNIPVYLVIEVVQCRLTVKEGIQLRKFCLSAYFFFFRGSMYINIYVLADLRGCIWGLRSWRTWRRGCCQLRTSPEVLEALYTYVDDTRAALPGPRVYEFLGHLNGVEPASSLRLRCGVRRHT